MKTLLILAWLTATTAVAAIKTETVEYKEGDTTLEGYLVYDDAIVRYDEFLQRAPVGMPEREWTQARVATLRAPAP